MTEPLFIDIETYCDLDLKVVGAYRYVEHPSFEILMAGWARGDDPVKVETDPAAIRAIPGLWDALVKKIAHNAAFERLCFSRFNGLPVGQYLPAEDFHDTMAIAAERGWPQKLEHLAKALGVTEKDTAGTRLISLFCKPYRGKRVRPQDRPADWADFMAYCAQDVETLREVHAKLGGWPTAMEREIYLADQAVNDRGIHVDVDLAQVAHRTSLQNERRHVAEFIDLTGVENPNSNIQVTKALQDLGLRMPDLQAATVEKALRQDLTDVQRRVLELRQELALVAAKKFSAALGSVNGDERLRGMFRFHGAHTGRWAGRGVQLHNLPRLNFENVVDEMLAIEELMAGEGASAEDLKRLVRSMFLGPMTVVDYSAIEARVIAWLAGEEWVLEAFRQGRDIYVETAKRMGGLTRSQGKVAVLALGYNGAVGSLEAMGAKGTEQQLLALVYQWRRANPKIVRFWADLDEAFRQGNMTVGKLKVVRKGEDRIIVLPSGRRLHYHGVNPGKRITFQNPARNMFPTDTYGGRLAENVTQAVARDLLGEAIVRLESSGLPVVGHVHDEILVEGHHPVEEVARIMSESPAWATGMPIAGEGFVCQRYRKG